MSNFPGKCFTKVHGSTLLALRGGGWVSIFRKKRYVRLEWPLTSRNGISADPSRMSYMSCTGSTLCDGGEGWWGALRGFSWGA